ncbi:MAG TPA: hypothetical protein VD789_06360 [Thermomicrobiales bacterium]|nr:hypothetical protein [Thermomicrobiales bacterium]
MTVANDLHALSVRGSLRQAGVRDCHIIECDRIAQRDTMSYGLHYNVPDRIVSSDGEAISVSAGEVLWLRTLASDQAVATQLADENAMTVIRNDCRGALVGYLATHFHGKWISTFEATYAASDKIAQLKAALESGFRIPRTLVSQSKREVEEFFAACDGQIIVKTVVGAPGPFLRTVKVEHPDLFDAGSYMSAPSLFQEYIAGTRHLRLNCFGPNSYAALIDSEDLDWRPNLNVPITPYPVDESLHRKVREVLDRLHLEMGIVDLKLTPEGEPVWLEVNPQGQFLFLDGLTDLRLADRFASYLNEERLGVAGAR